MKKVRSNNNIAPQSYQFYGLGNSLYNESYQSNDKSGGTTHIRYNIE